LLPTNLSEPQQSFFRRKESRKLVSFVTYEESVGRPPQSRLPPKTSEFLDLSSPTSSQVLPETALGPIPIKSCKKYNY
jgi:hypothetical protein